MKPYNELTRLGQLRRLRKLAEIALQDYGLDDAKLTFQHYSANIIFRVDTTNSNGDSGVGIFTPNRYNLRILAINDIDTINSEMTWLAALRHEAGLPVPEPVPTQSGKLFTKVASPGVPRGRVVTLMRWVDGHHIHKGIKPKHARTVGRLFGQMHQFSANWRPPDGFTRFIWDWNGLFGDSVLSNTSELIAAMPDKYREAFQTISHQIKEVTTSFGKGPDAYGLVHYDLFNENLLFKGNQPRPIDFEDCGYSHWMGDITIFLSQWPWTENFYLLRDALLDGYSSIRTLPESQLKHLDLFVASQYAMPLLWAQAFMRGDPTRIEEHKAWRDEKGDMLLRYFEKR